MAVASYLCNVLLVKSKPLILSTLKGWDYLRDEHQDMESGEDVLETVHHLSTLLRILTILFQSILTTSSNKQEVRLYLK